MWFVFVCLMDDSVQLSLVFGRYMKKEFVQNRHKLISLVLTKLERTRDFIRHLRAGRSQIQTRVGLSFVSGSRYIRKSLFNRHKFAQKSYSGHFFSSKTVQSDFFIRLVGQAVRQTVNKPDVQRLVSLKFREHPNLGQS